MDRFLFINWHDSNYIEEYEINELLDIKKSIHKERINIEMDILHYKKMNNDYDLKFAQKKLKNIENEFKYIEERILDYGYSNKIEVGEITGDEIVRNNNQFTCKNCFLIFKRSFMSNSRNICNDCEND